MKESRIHKILCPVLFAVLLFTAFSERLVTPTAAGSYNRTNAVAYADQWAKGRNGTYPNFVENDCTNFASQVMSAGGLPMISLQSEAKDWFINTGWWPSRSKSWSAADWFNTHLSQWQGGRYQTTNSAYNLQGGDMMVLQWSNSTVPSHVRVIVGWGPSQERVWSNTPPLGTNEILANQHSTDRKRIIWYDAISNTDLRWYWRVIW